MQMAKLLRMSVVLVVGAASAAVAPPARGAADEVGKREAVLEARLEAEEALAGRALDARIEGKKVVLSGVVKSAEDKALAERVVKRAGYARVDNQVTVDPAVAPPAEPTEAEATDAGTERRALSDPARKDPMVGTRPFEQPPTREERLRTMGMEDPKLEKQRQEAAAKAKQNGNTMTPTEAPPAGSDQAQTGNQSAPPAPRKPEAR